MSHEVLPKVPVVLLEDELMMGELLQEWICSQPDLEFVSAHHSVTDFHKHAPSWVQRVGLVATDMRLPDGDGLDAVLSLFSDQKRTIPTVVFSGKADMSDIQRLQEQMPSGWSFLSKSGTSLKKFRQAIDAAVNGLVMIDPLIQSASSNDVLKRITQQEAEVLRCVAGGQSNISIAETQFMSVKSVERILTHIYEKLRVAGDAKETNPRVTASLIYLGLLPMRD
jgi:DNA-binding NarL/FixJ family response regulator